MLLSPAWLVFTFGLVLILMAMRVPVGVTLILIGFVGIVVIQSYDIAVGVLQSIPFEFAASWSLSSLPMYLLMGYFAFHSGMATRIYNFVRLVLRNLPGALAVATTFACAGFGAICGSSGATAATFAKLSVPEMFKDGYNESLAVGTVAGAGTLGSLMPPSVLMIVYGVLAEESIGRIFMGGVLPAILSAILLGTMIVIRVTLNPRLAPTQSSRVATRQEKWGTFVKLWDVGILLLIVFGGIYSGVFTATEAGAMGAFAAFLIGLVRGNLNWREVKTSLMETAKITSMVLIIGVGANIYVRFMALAGLHEWLVQATSGMSVHYLLFVLFIVFFVLGMFLDPIGIMLLTVPILDPIMTNLGINKVWFAILLIKNMEIALITPPVGLNVYVVKGVMGDRVPIETIFKGIAWFVVVDLVTLAILYFFPTITLILPETMFGK